MTKKKSDQEKLVLAAQENEELYMNAAINANMGLLGIVFAEKATQDYIRDYNMPYDDMYSELKIGLIRAIRKYGKPVRKKTVKAGWTAFAGYCMRMRVLRLFQLQKRFDRRYINKNLEPLDEIGYCSCVAPSTTCTIGLHEILRQLPEHHAIVLDLRYNFFMPYQTIGHIMGYSQQNAHMVVQRALKLARLVKDGGE